MYQSRNIDKVISNFYYIKKIEFKDVKNFIRSFQNYMAERHPAPKKIKAQGRFPIEFKSKLKYDMVADLFINGRKLYFNILKEQDEELKELKLQYFYEPYGYPLFKLPNCNSKELWSGYISKNAMKALMTLVNPPIEREHAIARSVVIPKLFTDYYEFVEISRGAFFFFFFETQDGFGQFHLVTKVENSKLKEFQDHTCFTDPLLAYKKAGIELVQIDKNNNDVLYNIPKVNWWVSGKARHDQYYNKLDTAVFNAITADAEEIDVDEEINN
jgi:hypothetical protein